MSILSTQLVTTGTIDAPTNFIYIETNDTGATVTTAGYLNANLLTDDLYNVSKYSAALVYTTDLGTILLTVTVAASTVTLSYPAYPVSGNIMYNNITNDMQAASQIILDKGTVTQGTSGTTPVELNAQSGVITTVSLTTGANATVSFVLNNTAILEESVILVTANYGSNTVVKTVTAGVLVEADGSALITVANNSNNTALSGTVVIYFVIL